MMNSSFDLSRRNPQEDFELIQRIGSGTYGDVYKVKMCFLQTRPVFWTVQSTFKGPDL